MRHKRYNIEGIGEKCPKCSRPMERRTHSGKPKTSFFFKKWDYCTNCKHVQHYEKWKSAVWVEIEEQINHLKSIKNEEQGTLF